jgi:DNA ligase (NAD+)
MMKELLDSASVAYYNGTPIISDEEFDRLAEISGYGELGAPAPNAVPHFAKMYSLSKVHFGEEEPKLPEPVKTPKLDGAAISLLYIKQEEVLVLSKVLTRGNGVKGQDITEKVRHLVPAHFSAPHQIVQIVAEVVAPKTIPNSRNYAAGALNLKSIEEVKSRDLTVVAYGTSCHEDTYLEDLKMLVGWGFLTVDKVIDTFPTDGFVIRVNDNKTYQSLGFTAKHPRGAYALKPKAEIVTTVLKDVEWQVGRSGVVSPVAILEPVLIGDATVSRATLHNMDYINALNLELGCTVEVIRSGEIIPRIIGRV